MLASNPCPLYLSPQLTPIKKKDLEKRIKLQLADSEDLPFKNSSFDAITAGFGVRNFEDLKLGLSEMLRLLKKD